MTLVGRRSAMHTRSRFTTPMTARIPAGPVLDSTSTATITKLAAGSNHLGAPDSSPVYTSATTDTGYTVTCSQAPAWGPNPFANYNPIKIPAGAAACSGPDHWLTVIDQARGLVFNIWYEANYTAGTFTNAKWGAVFNLTDPVNPLAGSGSGAGISISAGTVRKSEMDAGVIPHALTCAYNLAKVTTWRYPATKTDGAYSGTGNVDEGGRIQLDPAYDVTGIAHNGQRMIAKALQDYGLYIIDKTGTATANGDANMHIEEAATAAYFGGTGYYVLSQIPWGSCRLLNTWNGL